MNIAILGNFGKGNLGNEATLQAILHHLRRRLPSAKASCICTGPEATAAALYEGLTIGPEDRKRMNDGARNVVRTNDIARWISNQVQDLRELGPVSPQPVSTAGATR